jgi:hypothetical protein
MARDSPIFYDVLSNGLMACTHSAATLSEPLKNIANNTPPMARA